MSGEYSDLDNASEIADIDFVFSKLCKVESGVEIDVNLERYLAYYVPQ